MLFFLPGANELRKMKRPSNRCIVWTPVLCWNSLSGESVVCVVSPTAQMLAGRTTPHIHLSAPLSNMVKTFSKGNLCTVCVGHSLQKYYHQKVFSKHRFCFLNFLFCKRSTEMSSNSGMCYFIVPVFITPFHMSAKLHIYWIPTIIFSLHILLPSILNNIREELVSQTNDE